MGLPARRRGDGNSVGTPLIRRPHHGKRPPHARSDRHAADHECACVAVAVVDGDDGGDDVSVRCCRRAPDRAGEPVARRHISIAEYLTGYLSVWAVVGAFAIGLVAIVWPHGAPKSAVVIALLIAAAWQVVP